MSYSRWFESEWYIFWDSRTSGTDKNNQSLAIWHLYDDRLPTFQYKELKEVKTIEDLKNLLKLPFEISDASYELCFNLIKNFIEDIDKIFGLYEIENNSAV